MPTHERGSDRADMSEPGAPGYAEQRHAGGPPAGRRPFVILWVAATVSFLGDGVFGGALPLLVASLTRDPSLVSVSTALSRGGVVAVGLFAGVLVDRWSKTTVMWRTDLVRAGILGVLAVCVLLGQTTLSLLWAATLMVSLAAPFFDSASAVLVPRLVPTPTLERANSRLQTSSLLGTMIVGPPLGAALFTWLPGAPVALEAASFMVSAVLIGAMHRHVEDRKAPRTGESMGAELVDGLRYLFGHRLLRTLMLLLAAINALTGVVLSLLVLYVLEVLGYPAAAYGWLITVFGAGGVFAAAVLPWITRNVGTFTGILLGASGFAVGALLLGLLPSLPWVVAGIVFTGIGSTLWNVVTGSLRQRILPGHLMGRVISAYRVVGLGAVPVGAVLGGYLAGATSVRTAYTMSGVALLAATALAAGPVRAGLRDLAEG